VMGRRLVVSLRGERRNTARGRRQVTRILTGMVDEMAESVVPSRLLGSAVPLPFFRQKEWSEIR
jgi:hypothetical protein